ncbi:uncharacterized protein LOC108045850 [Drosophila rhopaloa]|uniref:Uncharacterized protein LOC108045850 n=1 Tax=Drosophila rhopaloa TaxID=1041015 RepID=A0A6P4ERH3_DRORH|nr:uncharacterized protein LOC108045850 [Drosophila rhopaloa]
MLTVLGNNAKKIQILNWPRTHYRGLLALIKSDIKANNSHAQEMDTPVPMKLPHFIHRKCVQNQNQLVDGKGRKFTYNYHPFSIYDLSEATLRAKQATTKYYKYIEQIQKSEIEYVNK